jgi:LacI family repressor for deo operon, udp, cdd, tsx, nupC, and nupG
MYPYFTHEIAYCRFLVILLQLLQKFLQYLLAEGGVHMAGIKEVAEEAGVSTATVSRALRGLHHVNQQTREKIIAAAEKLNYPLVSERQNVVGGRTNAVGVVAPYISRWYFSQVISGAEQALREAGLDLLLYNFSQMKGRERLFQHQLLKGRVDALIVISLPPTEEEFDSILSLGVPIALVGMEHANCASIKIDDVAAAKTATQHLVNQGHKKIGLMSGRPDDPFNFSVPQDRRKGFMQALAESGLEWLPSREVHGDFTMHTASRAMDDLLARPNRPTAIFCESDEMAMGAMQALRRHGLKAPDDISIIGFDGHEMAEFSELTTVEQPVTLMGEMAAWSIMERLRKPAIVPPSLVLPTTLVVRNSTRRLTPEEQAF